MDDEVAQGPAYREVEDGNAPLWVPGGVVWIGNFWVNIHTHAYGAESCTDGKAVMPTGFYSIPGFYLDQDETTIALYDRCAEAGACTPRAATSFPTTSQFPATVTPEQAAAFCAWRGGDLPSYGQLRRAEMGDAEAALPVPSRFLWPWLDCVAEGFMSPDCQDLGRRAPADFIPNEPIRSDLTDVGPFGHYDLFGSQWEVTTTRFFDDASESRKLQYCAQEGSALPDLSKEKGVRALYSPVASFSDFNPNIGADLVLGIVNDGVIRNPAIIGVRCAYSRRVGGLQ